MRKLILGFIVLLQLLIVGCSSADLLNPPQKIDNYSKQFVSVLKTEWLDSALKYIDTSIVNQAGKDFLTKVSEDLKYKGLKSVKVLSYKTTSNWSTNHAYNISYTTEYEFNYDNYYYGFIITIKEEENKLSIIGFNGNKFDRPISEINKLSSSNLGLSHIIFIILSIAIVGFIIFSIIDIAKSEIKKKWIWIIISLIGFCGISLNWTTSDIDFKLLTIKLLGIGFSRAGDFAPWILSISIPIGAIIYWIKKPGLLYNQELEENLNKEK